MRQIDNMTPQEIEILELKGMVSGKQDARIGGHNKWTIEVNNQSLNG